MFGIGSTELLVILLVALIVLGPKSLAKLSRSLGKAMGEFRRVSTDFQRTLNAEAARDDLEAERARQKQQEAAKAESEATASAKDAPSTFAASETAASDKPGENPESSSPPKDSPLAKALEKSAEEARRASAESQEQSAGLQRMPWRTPESGSSESLAQGASAERSEVQNKAG